MWYGKNKAFKVNYKGKKIEYHNLPLHKMQ